ncbi:FtsX-like permease family protein [uncultured Rikenella sp.]|uniref:ABC transporter permease n=1 Tax=uncultured Rikenella sp. TaxID=368003 RepID=UPI0026377CB5|nr:FtsX-like permease family protein [uncultured Rikenella sp.]
MRIKTLFPRHKLYVRLNILGFAFALATVIFIGQYAVRELTMNMFHKDAERIYKISGWGCPYALAPTIAAGVPEIEAISNVAGRPYLTSIRRPDQPEQEVYTQEGLLEVDPGFFDVFSFQIIRGDRRNPFPDANSVVLTETTAKVLFGDQDPIGQAVTISDYRQGVVTAVTADVPLNSSIRFSMILPLNPREVLYDGMTLGQDWHRWQYEIFAKVRDGQDIAALNAKIQEVVRKNGNLQYEVERVVCYPLSDVYFNYADLFTAFKGGNHKQVMSMIWVGIIILLLAIVNFFNLSTAQGMMRAKEIGLRKVNGATRRMLIVRFLGESILMTFCAMLLALIIVNLLMPYFSGLAGIRYPFIWMNNLWQWGLLIGGTLVVGIIAGSYPAFYLSSLDPIHALYTGRMRNGRGVMLFRQILIVVQLIASIGVIACTLVISAQLNHLRTKDLGFDKEQIVCIGMDEIIYQHRQAFFSELRQLPFVQNISITQGVVGNIDIGGKLQGRYQEEKKEIWSKFLYVDTAFFSTFGVEMIHGDTRFREDRTNVILNESAMTSLQAEDYEQLYIQQETGDDPNIPLLKIAGVCRNFNFKPLRQGVEPLTIFVVPIPAGLINVRVEMSSVEDIQRVFGEIEAVYNQFNPSEPLQIDMLDTYLSRLYHSEQRFKTIFTIFSVLAVGISCFGIFGLIVFSNARRKKEIGVRKVQGATSGQIVALLIGNYLIYVGIAFLVATPIAYYVMSQWLRSYPYKITLHPGFFIGGGIIILIVVLLTVGLQSWRAATVNPVRSLRSE